MKSQELLEIKELLSGSKKIAIVTHRNPDGDAYGSSLGLYHFLKNKGHDVTVVSPNDCPEFLKWMPGEDEIVVFENEVKRATKILEDSELIFALDFNSFSRVGREMQVVLENVGATYFLIDHHQEPDTFAKYNFVDVKACSTCQLVYEFFEQLNELDAITVDMASCLYTGILTDTGSFRFPSTTSKTHMIAADLLDRGVEHANIYNKIHENSINRLKLLGLALSNIRILKKFHTAYITLSSNELRRLNYQKGDTEGFVNYALSLKGIVMAVIFIEDQQQGIVKISFRSIGDFSVNDLARENFDGGGHINAAGGRSNLSLEDTVEKFKEILPGYKNSLSKSYDEI